MSTTSKILKHSDLAAQGWKYVGWISANPIPECGKTFEQLKARALESDHGEARMLLPFSDASGVACYLREPSQF